MIAGVDGTAADGLPVQWVHGSEMLDPTPFLTPRTVLLTTGSQFAEALAEPDALAYVRRLQRAGATALGFGVGIAWARIPPSLVTACERLGLPLFRVPYATPFIAISQTAAQLIGANTRARDAWAFEAQRAVANAAAQRDGLASLVREAANRLGRWVAVADRTGRIIESAPRTARRDLESESVRHAVRALIERGTRASRVATLPAPLPAPLPEADQPTAASAEPAIELQTLGGGGRLLGALLTPATLQDQAERTLLGLIAALATVQLGHRAGQEQSERALRGSILQLLLRGEHELAERVAADALPRLPRGRVSVVRLSEITEDSLVDDLRSLAARPGLLTAPSPGGAVLVCESSQIDAVRRLITEHAGRAGVSERGTLSDLPRLLEQADTALERARSAESPGPVTYSPALHGGVLRLLDTAEARRQAESLLAPVRGHDERHGDAIERSLAVWLAHHGQTSPAAAELEVHRHTLRSRVQTAAALLQLDLDDPDARAELWAALRLLRQP
ncbi:MAG: PucR family transcriptional regulator ligand-binding domain-containing protein [Leucobacter sp.]|nr:PucR family transcriptional regulator ligand-binding domain-containing protein [Leucobacter sp.]